MATYLKTITVKNKPCHISHRDSELFYSYSSKTSGSKISGVTLAVCNKSSKRAMSDEELSKRIKNGGGGCYITSAICTVLDKGDDCDELQTFRQFRDQVMHPNPKWRKLIQEYYKTAPDLAEKLQEHPDSRALCEKLYREFLKPCLNLIQEKRHSDAINLYQYMTLYCQGIVAKPYLTL